MWPEKQMTAELFKNLNHNIAKVWYVVQATGFRQYVKYVPTWYLQLWSERENLVTSGMQHNLSYYMQFTFKYVSCQYMKWHFVLEVAIKEFWGFGTSLFVDA